MKILITLALLGSCFAELFEPQSSDNICMMCGDPVIRGFDGTYLMIYDNTKSLMTRFDDMTRNVCKFQVRCVTASTYKEDDKTEPIWVDWCGIAMHQHSSGARPEKFFRNWMVGQRLDKIGERGQGYSGILGVKVDEEHRTFPYQGEDTSTWNSNVPDPACDPAYEIWSEPENGVIKFRSYCCGWAVDFYPKGRDTCVNIYSQNGNAYIESFKGQMDGLCGNMDGDRHNDWRKCLGGGNVAENTAASLEAIAQSCIDGDHDGQSYIGGTKLDNI